MNIRLTGLQRKAIAAQLKREIDEYIVWTKEQEPKRNHLGASVIGKICNRRLVQSFRQMHRERFDARMHRLFERGHLEEARFIGWLRGIGATVWAEKDDGEQYKIAKSHGHFTGSLDGQIQLPERYQLPLTMLGEFKTHNDNSFKKLVKLGVKAAKPEHWAQMCVYGECYGYAYSWYFAINKNDDELHIELVELDLVYGRHLRESKAKEVIQAIRLPPKIAANAAYQECKWCPHSGICHNNDPVERHCRSCLFSIPTDDGNWHCSRFNLRLEGELIERGCGDWQRFV